MFSRNFEALINCVTFQKLSANVYLHITLIDHEHYNFYSDHLLEHMYYNVCFNILIIFSAYENVKNS